jgi:hypothetical protein
MNNDYVVATVNNLANIKNMLLNLASTVPCRELLYYQNQTDKYEPIFIHPEDEAERLIAGVAVQVIKKATNVRVAGKMSSEYLSNHYVPQWYQKRFIPEGQQNKELYYLDLKPGTFTDPRGVVHPKRSIYLQGTRLCFAEMTYTPHGWR